ncbi:hypothetical protein [Pleurochrysis sp. endemic virus 1b]|nr:hypothetical protein [Pleurochrysis sp. endemic virus 1b]
MFVYHMHTTGIFPHCNRHNFLPFSPYELILTHVATIIINFALLGLF